MKNKSAIYITLGVLAFLAISTGTLAVLKLTKSKDDTTKSTNSSSTDKSTNTGNNSQSDTTSQVDSCIVTIKGEKYDVTNFRNEHEGGDVFVCGTDMTDAYVGQHGNNTKQAEPYKVSSTGQEDTETLAIFTSQDLSQYNGEDLDKPIYIGLNGYVYDVSSGKEFYSTGKAYNFLAGKDSSRTLNLIGGDIIASKYPIVGFLLN